MFPCPCCVFETRDGIMYKEYSSGGSLVSIHLSNIQFNSFILMLAKSEANSNLLQGEGGL